MDSGFLIELKAGGVQVGNNVVTGYFDLTGAGESLGQIDTSVQLPGAKVIGIASMAAAGGAWWSILFGDPTQPDTHNVVVDVLNARQARIIDASQNVLWQGLLGDVGGTDKPNGVFVPGATAMTADAIYGLQIGPG